MLVGANFDAMSTRKLYLSKGDKLSSSAECRVRTQGLWNQISSGMNARLQTGWAIEDKAKTWIQQPVPMINKHPTADMASPLALAI